MTIKEYKAQWYRDNKDRIKDRVRENCKKWYQRTKFARREANRKRKHDWDVKNRDRELKKKKENYRNNKLAIREWILKKKYNISLLEYEVLLNKQNGCCAICGKHQTQFTISLSVDHNHITGKIRGLLCHKCNRGIGLFDDSPETMERASFYLRGEV